MSTLQSVRSSVADWFNRVGLEAPARLALGAFALTIFLFTTLLMLPAATSSGKSAPFIDSLFTATSAVCVTGLATVDVSTYYSPVGLAIIAAGIKVGGLGIMTLASLVGLAVSRRIGR